MSFALVSCVGVLVLAACGPRGRSAAALRGPAERWAPALRCPLAVTTPRLRRRRAPSRRSRDLAVVLAEVGAQLRAGAEPGVAWSRALRRPVDAAGVPDVDDLLAAAGSGRGRNRTAGRAQAAAVVAAGRLAAELGTPLASVLERVAAGLVSEAEAASERSAALAGPRSTARVLTGLPALGLVLGAAVGADPVGVLLDAGVGTASLGLGIGLMLLGRWWVSLLVRSAARAAGDR